MFFCLFCAVMLFSFWLWKGGFWVKFCVSCAREGPLEARAGVVRNWGFFGAWLGLWVALGFVGD
jgi:hypothetical protein